MKKHCVFALVLVLIRFLSMGQLNNPAPYCVSNFSWGCGENHITDVISVGGATNIINQNTNCGPFADGYVYYCDKYIATSAGQTLTLNINRNNNYPCGMVAFIDWNGDNVFTTPAETIGTSANYMITSVSFTFTIPPGQPNGKYRLRTKIRLWTNGASILPCGTFDKGETEDYDIYVGITPPSYPSATITSNSPLCAGQTLTFNVNYNGTVVPTYSWSGPASFTSAIQNPTISNMFPANSGNYTLTINDGTCPIVRTPQVIVYSYPSLTTVVTPSTGLCAGSTATLNVYGANSYTWSNGSPFPQMTVNPQASTNYSVIGSNWGCNSSTSLVVNVIPGISVSQSSAMICVGDQATITASGANSYTWDIGSNSPSIVISPTATTGYTVYATNGACQFSSTATQTVVFCTGIENFANEGEYSVFPNPFSDRINLNSAGEKYEVKIFNSTGQLILQTNECTTEAVIDTSKLSPGIYTLFIRSEKTAKYFRLLK